MNTDQDIKVTIAGRPYRMTVDRQEEELVRKAAEAVNKAIVDYSGSFEYKDNQDLFAMITLQHVSESLRLKEEKAFNEGELGKKLEEIDKLLDTQLDTKHRS